MATVTGFTSARMLQIENTTVVDGDVVGDNLILKTRAGTTIDAGNVRGPKGDTGPAGPVNSVNDQTGAVRSPRIFANKAALDLWVTAPRGSVAMTADNDVLWEKGATKWFMNSGHRIFATKAELDSAGATLPAGSHAVTLDNDSTWYGSQNTWNRNDGVRVFASVAERNTSWPAPPIGAMALTIDTNSIWQFHSTLGWRKPWNIPWGTQYYQKWGQISGAFGTTPAAIPGYSVLVNSPGGRLMEIETTLSVWNTGGATTEVVVEFRPAGGGTGIGQAATTAYANLTSQLKANAQWSPAAMNNVQYDLWGWTTSTTVQLYAQDPGRLAITTVRDHGPTP